MAAAPRPKAFSPFLAKWMLNLFPPWLVQGIRVESIDRNFRTCRVRVRRTLLTANLNGTTFGGAIFAAADPVYAVLYWQVFAHRGRQVQAWLRQAAIRYTKPATSALTLEFAVTDADVADADAALETEGRFARTHRVVAIDASGAPCAEIDTELYLRLPRAGQKGISAF